MSTIVEPPSIIPSKAALLMVDFQRDFCEKGGYADVVFGNGNDDDRRWVESIIPNAVKLLECCRSTKIQLIVHTREGYLPDLSDVGSVKLRRSQNSGAPIGQEGPLGKFLIRGEYGQDIIKDLQPKENEIVLDKSSYGAFVTTDLEQTLRQAGIEQIILAGVTADVCVHSTMREAVDRGFECWYCKDAISTPDPAIRSACESMVQHEGGIWGWLVTVDDVISSITQSKSKEEECT